MSNEDVTAKPVRPVDNSVVLRTRQLTNELQDIERRVAPGASEWLDLSVAWQAVLCIDRWQLLEFEPLHYFQAIPILNRLLDELQGVDTYEVIVIDGIRVKDPKHVRKPGAYWDGCRVHRGALQHLIKQRVNQRIALEALADPQDIPTETATPTDTKKRVRIGWIEIVGPYVAELYKAHEPIQAKGLYQLLMKAAESDASPFKVVRGTLVLGKTGSPVSSKTLSNDMKKIRALVDKLP